MTDCKETYSKKIISKPEKREFVPQSHTNANIVNARVSARNQTIDKYDLYHEQEMKKERERVGDVLSEEKIVEIIDEYVGMKNNRMCGVILAAREIRALLK